MRKNPETKKVSRKLFPWVLMIEKSVVAFGPTRNALVPLMQVLGGAIIKRTA